MAHNSSNLNCFYTGAPEKTKAHANLDLRESDIAAIAENLQATLTELKLREDLISRVRAIVPSTKDDVLNR